MAPRDYGLRLAQDGTAKAKKREVVAVAKKIVGLLLTVLQVPSTLRTFSSNGLNMI